MPGVPIALRGGVSVLVETLLEGLRAHYDLILVSPDQPAELANHPVAKIISGHVPWQPATVSPQTSRQLAQSLAERGVQLAHFHLGGNFGFGNRFPGHCPIAYADKLGIAVCSTVHLVVNPLDGYCGPQKPLWFKLALLPLAWAGKMQSLAHIRKEITVSHHDEIKLRRWYWPLRGKFLQMYHSRLRMDSRVERPVARGPMILNVGHIAWRKGQLVLAEAFAKIAARHPDWKLCLAGGFSQGGYVENIRALMRAQKLEDRILLPGERQDAIELMRRAGIYAQPSFAEALGLALQEAQFTGCACVGTRAGGIPELIEHERSGLLVDAGDVPRLAQALEILISNPQLRADYGRRGAASIIEKGMTAEQMVANHVQLYDSLLKKS